MNYIIVYNVHKLKIGILLGGTDFREPGSRAPSWLLPLTKGPDRLPEPFSGTFLSLVF